MATPLNPYFVKPKLDLISASSTRRRYVEQLLDLVKEPDYRANVAVIHETMFELLPTASANTALNRLLREINRAAAANKVPITACITADKKAGARNRWVWFEGPIGDPPKSATSELDSIADARLVEDQRGLPAEDRPVVILFTYNEHETAAVLAQFHPQGEPSIDTRNGITYNLLGVHGGMSIVHRVCRQGETQAQLAAEDAFISWAPQAMIGVGIAFGMNPDKQAIGDVLVSQRVRDYELARIDTKGTITARGSSPEASHVLYQRFNHLDQTRRARAQSEFHWPKLRFGTLLTGNKLVDDVNYRDSLADLEPEAVGGEMEALGLSAVCDRRSVDWIVVKAICDWGDGNKNNPSKNHDQRLAAKHAALVVHEALGLGRLYEGHHAPTPGATDARDTDTPARVQAPVTGQIRFRDLESVGVDIDDPRGRPASLDKDEADNTRLPVRMGGDEPEGVDVMGYLHEWISAVDAPPVFVLLGEYGMGKTVTCQRLAEQLEARHRADPTQPVPLYFDLRDVTNLEGRVPTLDEILQECMDRGWLHNGTAGASTVEHVYQWIDQGGVVIFDGLDEVLVKLTAGNGQVFTRTLLSLLDVSRHRQKANGHGRPPRVLVSCRTQYFRTLRDQQNHFVGQERGDKGADSIRALVLLPFNEEQVLRYLGAAVPGSDPARVYEMVRSVHNLEELARRPFTLKLVAEFIPQIEQDRLDGKRVYGVTLYRRMAQRWLERDAGKHHIQPEHKMSLAAHLAAYLWAKGSSALPAGDLEDWFHDWVDSQPSLRRRYVRIHPDQLEEDLRTATFLARDDVDGASRFRFAHASLQEFFLAEYLVGAIRDDAPSLWEIRRPSDEALDFLGQTLAESGDQTLLTTLQGWRHDHRPQANALLLAYALVARRCGWPTPALHGIQLQRASLNGWVIDGRGSGDTAQPRRLSLTDADFTGADLRDTVFADLQLDRAVFDNCRLRKAEFHHCRAPGSRWLGTECTATIWLNTDLTGAEWDTAYGYHPQFLRCLTPPSPVIAAGLVRGEWAPASNTDSTMGRVPQSQAQPTWLTGHTGPVLSCAWSTDGSRLASASHDGTVRVWDATSGQQQLSLTGHTDWVRSCAWSTDGSRLASASHDGTVRVWDATSGQQQLSLTGHTGWVRSCAWSTDGSRLASASDDGTVRVWDATSGGTEFVMGQVAPGPLGVGGYAVWAPRERLVIEATGEAWRCLVWEGRDSTGAIQHLPLDYYGEVPQPKHHRS